MRRREANWIKGPEKPKIVANLSGVLITVPEKSPGDCTKS